jgi:hypothetical protein
MLKLKANNLKTVSERAHARADRASNPQDASGVLHDTLAANATDVGEDTGRLQASLQPGHPEHLFVASGKTFTFGSTVPYAKYYFARMGLTPVTPQGLNEAAARLAEWIVRGK